MYLYYSTLMDMSYFTMNTLDMNGYLRKRQPQTKLKAQAQLSDSLLHNTRINNFELPSDSTLLSRWANIMAALSSRFKGFGWAGRDAHRFSLEPDVGRRLRGLAVGMSLCDEER